MLDESYCWSANEQEIQTKSDIWLIGLRILGLVTCKWEMVQIIKCKLGLATVRDKLF